MGLCPSSNLFQPSCSKGCYSSPTNTHSSTLTHCFHCSLFYSPLSLPQRQVSAVQVMLHKVGGRQPLIVRTSACVKPPVTLSHSHKHTTTPHILNGWRHCVHAGDRYGHKDTILNVSCFYFFSSSVAAAYSDAHCPCRIRQLTLKYNKRNM